MIFGATKNRSTYSIRHAPSHEGEEAVSNKKQRQINNFKTPIAKAIPAVSEMDIESDQKSEKDNNNDTESVNSEDFKPRQSIRSTLFIPNIISDFLDDTKSNPNDLKIQEIVPNPKQNSAWYGSTIYETWKMYRFG
jgi:hypothetical protein